MATKKKSRNVSPLLISAVNSSRLSTTPLKNIVGESLGDSICDVVKMIDDEVNDVFTTYAILLKIVNSDLSLRKSFRKPLLDAVFSRDWGVFWDVWMFDSNDGFLEYFPKRIRSSTPANLVQHMAHARIPNNSSAAKFFVEIADASTDPEGDRHTQITKARVSWNRAVKLLDSFLVTAI